ncbi:MAG: hypothetical protein GY870_22800, partial [archaeon]|nr:hypothetical protein [archaeon]
MKSTKSKKNQYYLFMGIVLLLSTLKFVSPINAAALIAFPDQVDDVYSSADNGYVITHPELDLTGARRTGNEFKIWLNDEVDQSLTGTDKTKITIIFSNTGEDQLLESIDVWIFILTIDTSGIEITLIDPTFQIKTGISSSIDKKIITMTIDTSTIQLTDYAAF